MARFVKGQSGNPGGRPNHRPWRDAINMALKRGDDSLQRIADKIVAMALEGDMHAIREIADRLDGKALQMTQVDASVEVVDDPHDIAMGRLKEIAERLGLALIAKAADAEEAS